MAHFLCGMCGATFLLPKFNVCFMFSNYLKLMWRGVTKNKAYVLLNVIGLAAGLTCFTFIALWINDELSYDKFNT